MPKGIPEKITTYETMLKIFVLKQNLDFIRSNKNRKTKLFIRTK